MSQLGEGLLLGRDTAEDDEQDDDQRGEIVRNRLGHPKDKARREYGQHRIVGPYERGQAYLVQPCQGLSRHGFSGEAVDEAEMSEPVDKDKGKYGERAAETRHPDLEAAFLHLRKLFEAVVVHIQRV